MEVAPKEVIALLSEIETLQTTHRCLLHLGSYTINASYKGDLDAGSLISSSTEELSEMQIACRILTDQRKQMEEREQIMMRTEEKLKEEVVELRGRLNELRAEKAQMEEEHERLISEAKRQNVEALTLKEKIEGLLLVQEESASDLSSIYASEVPSMSISHIQFDTEVETLRRQVRSLPLDSPDFPLIKRELDLTEDILVGVINGDDPRKLFLQITVVKNRLVQHQGKQVMRDAEKMAMSIKSTLNALEHNRAMQKSKNRIKEELLKRLSTPQFTPMRSPSRTPKPVIVTMESVMSPIDSPQTSHRQDFDLSVVEPKKPPKSPMMHSDGDVQHQLELAQDRTTKLRNHVKDLQAKLDKYRAQEKRIIEASARVKISEKRLSHFKETFETREKLLVAREVEMGTLEDNLRREAAKSLNTREAREFLSMRAKNLAEQNARLEHETTLLELQKTELRAGREELNEVRRTIDKERKKLLRDQARVEKQRKKVMDSKKELEDFLQTLGPGS